jgi:hypothetical protein
MTKRRKVDYTKICLTQRLINRDVMLKKIIYLSIFLFTLFTHSVFGTKIASKSIEELVRDSDHVIIAKVIRVEMIDAGGKLIIDKNARTGPGSDNQLQLILKVSKNGIIFSNVGKLPETVTVKLWKMRHLSIGGIKDFLNKEYIFLLKGKDYQPIYPAMFKRNLTERKNIETLASEKKGNKAIKKRAISKKHQKSLDTKLSDHVQGVYRATATVSEMTKVKFCPFRTSLCGTNPTCGHRAKFMTVLTLNNTKVTHKPSKLVNPTLHKKASLYNPLKIMKGDKISYICYVYKKGTSKPSLIEVQKNTEELAQDATNAP